MTESGALWAYAVGESAVVTEELAGIDGGRIRAFSADGLAAYVSEVSLEEYGGSALQAKLEDLAWLEATATAHHLVVAALASAHPIVPMRLATVFTSETSLLDMLADRGPWLRDVLRRISRRQEWGVKAFAAEAEPSEDRSAEEEPVAAQVGSGAAYLQRRKAQLAASKHARHDEARSATEIHAALSGLASDARLHPPQVPQLAGTKATMLINGTYLVDESRERFFKEAVQQLATRYRGITLQLTGPWPPYSFASMEAPHEEGR